MQIDLIKKGSADPLFAGIPWEARTACQTDCVNVPLSNKYIAAIIAIIVIGLPVTMNARRSPTTILQSDKKQRGGNTDQGTRDKSHDSSGGIIIGSRHEASFIGSWASSQSTPIITEYTYLISSLSLKPKNGPRHHFAGFALPPPLSASDCGEGILS